MNKYSVFYLDSAIDDVRKIDNKQKQLIRSKIEKILACDPKGLGKPLKGEYKGYWRYRVGNYRAIYRISEKQILLVVVRIGHRKDVYE